MSERPAPAPPEPSFRDDVLRGLRQPRKHLPCKYLYDRRGSQLFDQICELEEYYPTRTELAIMRRHAPAMAGRIGSGCLLVEYGSGSGTKTRLLLDQLREPAAYLPVDISREQLFESAAALARDYPHLEVIPVWTDFTVPFDLPASQQPARRRVVYFPGSTIGNFGPATVRVLLQAIVRQVGRGGGLLIGVDLEKDPRVVEPAYNDRRGVTAAFNLNLLARINRELGGNFQLDAFEHRAFLNRALGRIEMHLVSRREQTVRVGGEAIRFAVGESICTEHSYKYSPERFAALAGQAGLRVEQVWTDTRQWFGVQYLTVD